MCSVYLVEYFYVKMKHAAVVKIEVPSTTGILLKMTDSEMRELESISPVIRSGQLLAEAEKNNQIP